MADAFPSSPPRLLPALMGGLFLGILSVLPIVKDANACCCAWVVIGGVLAAWMMQQNHPQPITLGDGALVGLLAGIVGFVVGLVAAVPVAALMGSWQPMGDMSTEGMPPEMRDALARINPATMMVAMSIVFFGVSLVFSTMGGLVGAALFRKRVAPPPPPPPAGPPPFVPLPPPPVPEPVVVNAEPGPEPTVDRPPTDAPGPDPERRD